MVAFGHTSAEIAAQLSLSAKTVETYRARGMEKLGLRTRAALVKFALQEGLIKRDCSSNQVSDRRATLVIIFLALCTRMPSKITLEEARVQPSADLKP